MKQNLTVSVVIPTFSAKALLAVNLPAVEAVLRPQDELVIVDDASTDDTVNWLTQRYQLKPESETAEYRLLLGVTAHQQPVKVIVNQVNARFAVTSNRGVEVAQGDLVLLLNNDVKPEPDVLQFLIPDFEDPEMFAVGCHELEGTTSQISSGKKKLWFSRGLFQHSRDTNLDSGPTDWVSGGSSLFDRQKWLKLGGFDPAFYPAYWEDVDLSFRASQRGWKLWFEAQAIVHHNHESTNQTVFGQLKIDDISWKNGQVFLWKHARGRQRLWALVWAPYWFWQRARARQKLSNQV